ncbi:MAG: TolC family protein [Deltaproteobacteria bacterium]|jgi:outer membrane protein|nr:TolC family protein [Deltaproteobacteria bacterium]
MFSRLGALCLTVLLASPATLFAAEQVTLVDAVKRALAANPAIHSARASSDAAEAGRKSARGAFGPALSASYGFSRTMQEREPTLRTNTPPYGGMFEAVISLNQNLFTGFRLLSAYQKAALEAESRQLNLRLAQLNLVAGVQNTFFSYLQAVDNVRSQRDSLTRLREQLQITKASFEVGLRPHLDVLQAEVDVSRAESLLIGAENARETHKAQLNTLLGLPVTADLDYVGILAPVPFNLGLEACLDTAYRQRPDLGIAAKAVAIAGKDVRIVQSQYYPQVAAYYGITNTGDNLGLRHVHTDGYRSTRWEIGVLGTWTLFEWGKTFYADQQARFVESQMRADEASLKLNAGFDVKSKLLAVRDAEKLISVAAKGLEQAQEAYKQAQARYRAQVGTNFDVLDASANLTAAETTLIGAKAAYLTALSALYAAMGEMKPDVGFAGN